MRGLRGIYYNRTVFTSVGWVKAKWSMLIIIVVTSSKSTLSCDPCFPDLKLDQPLILIRKLFQPWNMTILITFRKQDYYYLFKYNQQLNNWKRKLGFKIFTMKGSVRRLENIYTLIKFTQVKLEICPGLRTKHSKHWLISRFWLVSFWDSSFWLVDVWLVSF